MPKIKQTKRKYHSKEEEVEARLRMEERERRDIEEEESIEETQESQEGGTSKSSDEEEPASKRSRKKETAQEKKPLGFTSSPSEEEEAHAHPQYKKSTVQTETVSQVTTEAYVHVPPLKAPATTSKIKTAKKVPKKEPSTTRPRPGSGALNYAPSEKETREAQ